MNVVSRALHSVKAATLTVMHWARSGGSMFSMLVGSTNMDYRSAAGDGRTNAAVMACVRWVQRALPEAPLQVVIRNAQGELTPALDHRLQELLERPNPHYSGLHLLGAIVSDLMLTGNAYLLKLKARDGRVVQLWWIPSTQIEPAWPDNDPTVFISHYAYTVEGQVYDLDPSNVIHIRDFPDPVNLRKGLSPLTALYREIATDNEAANWTASMLRNVTPPGVVVTPGKDVSLTKENAEQIKTEFSNRFGGDRRGSAMVLSAEAEVRVLSFSPDQMALSTIRNVPEERITAIFGIPASVVGLGTGLEQTKVGATMAEQRQQAYESCLIPLQRMIAAEFQQQLVPDFGQPSRLRVQFDLSQVRVLQDDQNALHERARADLLAGLITRNQALQVIGEEPVEGPEGDVLYVPNTVTVKTADTLIPPLIEDVTPEQPALTDGSDEEEDEEPAKRLVAARSNGHANGKAATATAVLDDLGPALLLTDAELDRLSRVDRSDVAAAERLWRRIASDGLAGLIDAESDDGA